MCGICGVINLNKQPVFRPQIEQMMSKIKHRGPDDEGVFIDKNIGLGFVRLSIIDLSAQGHQPMHDSSSRYTIVFNGEIYNYLELREELKLKGYKFRSNSDTEVLLYSYIEWKEDFLSKLNGMFAMAIHDKKTGRVFIARDRYGIKPFYYYLDRDRFVFASEQRALLSILKNKTPNSRAIFEYLLYGRTNQGEYTFFEEIKKLPHATQAIVEGEKLTLKKWYNLREELKTPFINPEEYFAAFRQSIKFRLRSDVPVGVCLSGGLDSSGITSVLLKEFDKTDLNTFSAVYSKDDPADESKYIEEFSGQLENMFYVTPSAESLLRDLDTFVECHSEPVGTLGPYAQYKVMELAQKHVVVTLDGQGADESLAGYDNFYGSYFKYLFKQLKWALLVSEMFRYLKNYKSAKAFKFLLMYTAPSFVKDQLGRMTQNYLNKDFFNSMKVVSSLSDQLYSPKNLNDSLIQHFEYKLEHLLKWEDHNSMWFSLESRVPFLDHNLVEKTLSSPVEHFINKGIRKYIFREALSGVMPEKIRTRMDKVGFATPWSKWFRDEAVKNKIMEILNSSAIQERGILNQSKCLQDYNLHLSGEKDISGSIWRWLNLELWYQKFID